MMILKKKTTQIKKFKVTFVPKFHIYNPKWGLLSSQIISLLKFELFCFCLLFKIISTAVAETTNMSCSYGSSA